MMSQNRQDTEGPRAQSEMDFDVNRRAESEIQDIGKRLSFLVDKVGDLDERLRGPEEPRRKEEPQG